jgi:UDP-glucose 4-epimerase
MSENICKEYHSVYQAKVAIVRPFSVYGPGLQKQLFWDLFTKCQKAVNNTIDLWGNGKESRDFIFIDDLMNAFDAVVSHANFQGEEYNVAAGVETSVAQAANFFVQLVDPKIKITFSQRDRLGDPQNWCADISRLRQLGFAPRVSFDDGIQKLMVWMKNQK